MVINFDSPLRILTTPGPGGKTLPVAQELSWSGVEVEFYTLYDMLGYILSILAEARFSRTTKESHLLLQAVFAKWCMLLAEERRLPVATFVTIRPGKHPKIFLGARGGKNKTGHPSSAVEVDEK